MRSRWERFTRSVVALRLVPLALRPGTGMLGDGGREAPVRTLLAMLVACRPHGAVRVEIRDLRRSGLARAVKLGSREADRVAVAEVTEVAGARLEASRVKASRRVAVVAVVIATQLAARAEPALLAVVWARAALTPGVERAIRCGGYTALRFVALPVWLRPSRGIDCCARAATLHGQSEGGHAAERGDYIDELNAEDGTPACQLHEGRVRAAGDQGKGDEERKPRIGHHHGRGGEMRGIALVGAGLREGSGGGRNKGWRGEGVSGLRRGRNMPRKGTGVSAGTVSFDPAHGE
eukprot:6212632-Pleurochrysis_carterae.AAC.5